MKVRSKKDLPDWFNLENYAAVYKLTDEECWEQVIKRCSMQSFMADPIDDVGGNFTEDDFYLWRAITSGITVLKSSQFYMTESELEQERKWEESNKEQEEKYQADWQKDLSREIKVAEKNISRITGSRAITGLDVRLADAISSFFREKNLIVDDEDSDRYSIKSELLYSDVNLGAKAFDISLWGDDSVFIKIDLDECRDDEIVEQFSELLPIWRKEMEVTEPQRTKVRQSHFSRIKTYKIIPFLDLSLWAKDLNITIPYSVYAAALFPDGEKGDTEFRQTIKKYVDELYKIYEESF